jgi:hypothetical protein
MTELKLLLAGVIAAARLATAVMAWKHHLNAQHDELTGSFGKAIESTSIGDFSES